ncbi:MAG: gamma-glutamyltransferase [Ignavibacteriales bacterium]|nr:gamma-glutamyltransferase [Ignavibacteriales bacterium]
MNNFFKNIIAGITLVGSICFIAQPISTASKDPARARHGMVVSADELASKAGVEILKKGGNAVDAAVAVGFALAVTYPQAGNIGGGGYMVIRMADGRATTIDYREKAPAAAYRDMFLDGKGNFLPEKSQKGYLASGVPGSVAGMLYALDKYGKMKRQEVIAPAATLAKKGFVMSYRLVDDLSARLHSFLNYPSTKKVFTKQGQAYEEGDKLVQSDLGNTLNRIQRYGRDGFYKGKTADLIVAAMKRGGGIITREDLANYQPVERPPVRGTYRGYEVISMGPSSSGGTALIHLLNILEGYDIGGSGFGSSKTISLMAEAMKLTYADRAEYLGDPDFYPVPVEKLISKEYATQRRTLIDVEKATPSSAISHGNAVKNEGTHTTHYSVVDQWGNAVSVTTTINDYFGNDIVVDGAGFFLNNEMDDFSAKPGTSNMFGLVGGEANSVQPNKRMLSAMTPTIIVKDNQPFMVIGTPGGSTIITTVLQVILNVIDHKMNIQEAVDAPRVHHQWLPDTLYYEKRGLPQDVVENLVKHGYAVRERPGYRGLAQGIVVDKKKGLLYGATDPRGYGGAIGY